MVNTKVGNQKRLLFLSEAYHTVACSFAPSTTLDVTNRFMIVDNEIKVFLLEGVDLDRETLAEFVFDLNCYDDPQRQGITKIGAFCRFCDEF